MELVLPDRVAVRGVLAEVLEQLQQGQLDALLGGDVGVADELVQSFTDVPGGVLQRTAALANHISIKLQRNKTTVRSLCTTDGAEM